MSHKTALCLIPPNNVWEQIQAIRSVHDKAYPRWMPHVNLIYPFVPESEFPGIKDRLDSVLNSKSGLEIEFDQDSIQYFQQKGRECTFHLRPKISTDVNELYQLIQNVVPNYLIKNRPFEAHLTLGQTTTARISDVLIEMKAKWKTIKFTIDRVCLISREDDPNDLFSIKSHVLLVGTKENGSYVPPPPVEQLSPVKKNSKQSSSSSKTSLCIVYPYELSTRLLHLFEDTSFHSIKPFRIILAEYDHSPRESDLRTQVDSIPKFTLDFGPRAICFNYSTSRLFLKPTDTQAMQRLNLNNDKNFDGTLTLGELDKNDLTEVGNRYAENWTFGTSEFEVDRIHLIDEDGRFQCTFPLRSQCFS